MTFVAADLYLDGLLLESSVHRVGAGVWFGDIADVDCLISFPGAAVRVYPSPRQPGALLVQVAGRASSSIGGETTALSTAEGHEVTVGRVVLRLRAVKPQLASPVNTLLDPRIFVLTAAAIVAGVWVDVVSAVIDAHPEAVAVVAPVFAAPTSVQPQRPEHEVPSMAAWWQHAPVSDLTLTVPLGSQGILGPLGPHGALGASGGRADYGDHHVRFIDGRHDDAARYPDRAPSTCGAACPPDAPSTPVRSTP